MANISEPFPLLSTNTSSSKTYASAVANASNQVVLAVEGEGVSIHNVHPVLLFFIQISVLGLTFIDITKQGTLCVFYWIGCQISLSVNLRATKCRYDSDMELL